MKRISVLSAFWAVLIGSTLGLLPLNRAAAQNLRGDIVHLRNGSAVAGRIIAKDSLGVRIYNKCGIWQFGMEEIDRVELRHSAGLLIRAANPRGYYNYSSAALLMGIGREGFVPVPSLLMVNGYRFNKHISAGFGIGYEFYEWRMMPVFGELRFFANPNHVTPFISAKAGYGVPLQGYFDSGYSGTLSRVRGGWLVSPEAGLRIYTGHKNALILAIGYRYQQLFYSEDQPSWSSLESNPKKVWMHYNRISFRVGLMFQ